MPSIPLWENKKMGMPDQPDWPALVPAARSLPLDMVTAALDCRRDVMDKTRWARPGSILRINDEMQLDHMSGTGGGAPISLVKHAAGRGFRDAVASCQRRRFAPAARTAPPAGQRNEGPNAATVLVS